MLKCPGAIPREWNYRSVPFSIQLLMTGCITDYMTRDEAQRAGIPEPSITDFFDPPRDVKYPVVRFAKMRYCKYPPPPAMLIAAMGIDIKTSRDIKIASRKQVPMILAW
jgi:hypothetical protein